MSCDKVASTTAAGTMSQITRGFSSLSRALHPDVSGWPASGWLGHCIEQLVDNKLIRPHEYTGPHGAARWRSLRDE